MEEDRKKWDGRYGGDAYFFSLAPSAFLSGSLGMIRTLLPGMRALDVACGEGRNSIYLAREGFCVTGIDISGQGLARASDRAAREGVTVDFLRADLEEYHLVGSYDLIVNFNFLLRPLVLEEVAALSPGGVLILETILDAPNLVGVHRKAFLLEPGELRRMFEPLAGKILHLEELPDAFTPVARVIFRKEP